MGRRRGGAAVVALAVAWPALAGCGDDGSPAAPDTLAKAAATTIDHGGYHLEMEARIKVAGPLGETHTLPFKASGDVDDRTHRSDLTWSYGLGRGSTEFGGARQLTGRTIERGTHSWFRMDFVNAALRRADIPGSWLEFDAGRRPGPNARALRELGGYRGQNPGHFLDYAAAAAGNVRRLRDETTRGVKTAHYRGAVQLDRLGQNLPADLRAPVARNGADLIRATGRPTVGIEVWLDGRGLVRRLDLHYRLVRSPETGKPVSAKADTTVYLSGFGRRVLAPPPPAQEIIDATQLQGLID